MQKLEQKVELKVKGKVAVGAGVCCVGFIEDGSSAFFGYRQNFLLSKLNKLASRTQVAVCENSNPVLNIKSYYQQPFHTIATVDATGCVCQFRLNPKQIKRHYCMKLPDDDYSKALDLREELIVVGGSHFAVRLIDRENQTVICNLMTEASRKGHTNRVFCTKFSKNDKNLVVSGGWDTAVRIWDLRSKASVGSILGTFICGESIDLSNEQLLIGNLRAQDKLEIYDLRTLAKIKQLPFQGTAGVAGCCFDYYHKSLVAAVGGNEVSFYNARNEKKDCLSRLKLQSEGLAVAMSLQGHLAVACEKGEGLLLSLELLDN